MNAPTTEQREELLDHLDALPSTQWLSLMRWIIDRVVEDDQQLAAVAIFREADRRTIVTCSRMQLVLVIHRNETSNAAWPMQTFSGKVV